MNFIDATRNQTNRWGFLLAVLISPMASAEPLADQTPGTWIEFPNSNLDEVGPNPAPPGYLAAIMAAWGGGAYDSDRDQLIVWGGGHGDYSGNEVYAFGPLADGNPSWARLTDPTLPPAENTSHGVDGRPVSRHTYNLLDYMPAPHNKMVSCAVGSQYSNGYSNVGFDFFDFQALANGEEPWSMGPNPPQTQYALEAFCVYNPATDSVWFHDKVTNQSRLMEYDPSTNSWSSYATSNFDDRQTAAIDPTRNILVSVGDGGETRVWDLNNPAANSFVVSSSGPQAIENAKAPGFEYDPVNNNFVGWSGGSSIYSLTPPSNLKSGTWVWSEIPLDPSNTVTPTDAAGQSQVGYVTGTYGRFRYVPSAHGLVLVNATDENVYFFKLPDNGGQLPPTASLNASPTTVNFNGSTTLSWSSANTTACTASDGWSGNKSTSGSETVGPLTADTTFVLQCTAASGATVTRSVTVNVLSAAPEPTVSIEANPTTVSEGGFASLSWSSANATACDAGGSWSGPKSVTGSESVGPLDEQSVFTLTCTGPGGSASASATVAVDPVIAEPIVNFSASPSSISGGQSSTLSWSSANADNCTATGGWSGNKGPSGSEGTGSLQSTTQYNLSCSGDGGTVSRSVTVSVSAQSPNPPDTGGDADTESSGGGAIGLALLAGLAALFLGRRRRIQSMSMAVIAGVALSVGAAQAAPVTTIQVQNLDGQSKSNTHVTFGHVFRPGDVAANETLVATLGNGTAVPLQVDRKATHADGSLRHAILTLSLDTLAGGANDSVTLSTASTGLSGSAVTLAELLATNFDADVTMNVGGTQYTASARDALANATQWLEGPVVSEWIAGGSVVDGSGNAHPHLAVYFHVRAYAGEPLSRARVDVVFENNWSFVPGPQNRSYDVTITVPGSASYQNSLNHYSRARWHRVMWWGGNPNIYAKLDHDYLQSTKAIPRYEDVQPDESFLNAVRQSTEPMQNGDHTDNMDSTGYQAGIGPLPQWDAVFAVSADVRAFNFMLANSDGGGAYSIHLRDEATGYPISIDDYPNATLSNQQYSDPQLPPPLNGSPYFEGSGSSHQPSVGYLPYLVTGDYFYLEEMQFWSAFNLIWTNAQYRNGASGWWYTGSLRGQAWAYRSLAQAAYATPDSHPTKAYWIQKLLSNIANDTSKYVSPGAQANNLGAMYYYDGTNIYSFFDYFMSWSVQYLVDLGFEEAVGFRDYKVQFPIGLMGDDDSGYCFQSAPRYNWKAGPGGTNQFYPDFRTVYETTVGDLADIPCGSSQMSDALGVGPNGMTGDPTSTTYWFANLQPALAAAYDSGVAGGTQAWNLSRASGVTPDYSNNPIWAVIPHNLGSPQLSVGISANPTSVQPGGSTTLSWTSQNADTCSASGDWAGNKATSGSESVSGINDTSTFTLTCQSNTLGSSSDSAIVTVNSAPPPPAAPTLEFSSDASTIESGDSVSLSWTASNASGCTASGDWSGSKPTSGNETMTNLTSNQSFTLDCTGAGGDISRTLSVTVNASTGGGGSGGGGSGGGGSGGGGSGGGGDDDSGGGGATSLFLIGLLGLYLGLRRRPVLSQSAC